MSQTMLDRGQIVGYDFGEKKLVVTVSDKIARKMMSDGWIVHHDGDLGYFVTVPLSGG